MNYYKANDLLIQFNPDTGVYKVRNSIERKTTVLSVEEFKSLNAEKLKKQKFCELMNIYFKNVKHDWDFEGVHYRKLENFEKNEANMCTNYDYMKLPRHIFEQHPHLGSLILVYHWGRVYYMLFSYGGYEQGILYDTVTLKHIQWAKPKHCAPIFNEQTKKIA